MSINVNYNLLRSHFEGMGSSCISSNAARRTGRKITVANPIGVLTYTFAVYHRLMQDLDLAMHKPASCLAAATLLCHNAHLIRDDVHFVGGRSPG
jgi:hypothetical protein